MKGILEAIPKRNNTNAKNWVVVFNFAKKETAVASIFLFRELKSLNPLTQNSLEIIIAPTNATK